jgi:hypothetical protein
VPVLDSSAEVEASPEKLDEEVAGCGDARARLVRGARTGEVAQDERSDGAK